MNHKRGRPKNRRSGCLMCKSHKINGNNERAKASREARRLVDEHYEADHNALRDYLLVYDEYEEIPA